MGIENIGSKIAHCWIGSKRNEQTKQNSAEESQKWSLKSVPVPIRFHSIKCRLAAIPITDRVSLDLPLGNAFRTSRVEEEDEDERDATKKHKRMKKQTEKEEEEEEDR